MKTVSPTRYAFGRKTIYQLRFRWDGMRERQPSSCSSQYQVMDRRKYAIREADCLQLSARLWEAVFRLDNVQRFALRSTIACLYLKRHLLRSSIRHLVPSANLKS